MRKITILSIIATVCFIAAQGVFAGTYVGTMKGTICQAYVDYNNSNTITITAGYGECNGHYWEITKPILHDMTSLTTSEDFHYVYIDDTNSDYPYPEIIDCTTEPNWSNAKLGWYNGNDRCIGVVWSPNTGATIAQFISNEDGECLCEGKTLTYNMAVNGNWQDPTSACSDYVPVNATHVRIYAKNYDDNPTNDVVVLKVTPVEDTDGAAFLNCTSWYCTTITDWLPLGPSRDIKMMGQSGDNAMLTTIVHGWKIQR